MMNIGILGVDLLFLINRFLFGLYRKYLNGSRFWNSKRTEKFYEEKEKYFMFWVSSNSLRIYLQKSNKILVN